MPNLTNSPRCPNLRLLQKIYCYSRLNGIKPCHLHLQQTVFPIVPGHTGIVNATRDVAEWLPILDEAVAVIVNSETSLRYALHVKKVT